MAYSYEKKMLSFIGHQGNANKNHNQVLPYPSEWVLYNNKKTINGGQEIPQISENKYTICTTIPFLKIFLSKMKSANERVISIPILQQLSS